MRAGGVLIPANTVLTGTARIDGERMMITVSAVQYRGSVIPVELDVYKRQVRGNGKADYAPCPQPQRPEGKRELGTAHVGPKAQDHCVVSELPQAAASGESLD